MPIPADESELLIDLIRGDRAAFDTLYRRYFHAVYCNALKLTRDTVLAEDVLQEVFIALWNKKESIDSARPLGGWLFVICYNKSISQLRKKLKESIAYSRLSYQTAEEHDEEDAVYTIQWEMLEKAIAQLSPQKRKVFELCKLQGKTYEETAATLHISKHTVKEYLMAATGMIKEYVQHQPESSVVITAGLMVFIMN